MATPTSSSNRSKRKTNKPVTTSKGRQNRSSVSTAKVTNSSTRGSNAGSAKVTTGKGGGGKPPKALPPGTKGGPLATQGRTSLKGQPQLPPGRKGGPMAKAGPTVDVTANAPKLKGSTPKPSGNFKAPNIPKPKGAAPKPNALTRNLNFGLGAVAAMVLGAANAADDARLTPAQLRKKYEVVNPDRGQNLLTKFQSGTLGQPDKPKPKQGNAQSRFAGARDRNIQRINSDPRFAAPKETPKPPDPPRRNPPAPAPAADQRRSGGGGNNTAPRSQTPPTPRFTGTVDEGRKMWAEKYSSSKYDGQAIQKEAKKLLEKMKERKEDKSNAQRAGWDGNKNY